MMHKTLFMYIYISGIEILNFTFANQFSIIIWNWNASITKLCCVAHEVGGSLAICLLNFTFAN